MNEFTSDHINEKHVHLNQTLHYLRSDGNSVSTTGLQNSINRNMTENKKIKLGWGQLHERAIVALESIKWCKMQDGVPIEVKERVDELLFEFKNFIQDDGVRNY